MSRRFFFAMDDDAIALDAAINQLLDGDRSATRTIRVIERRVQTRINRRLLDGADNSVGANLILSAATEAKRATDLTAFVRARQWIVEGRAKLADEVTP